VEKVEMEKNSTDPLKGKGINHFQRKKSATGPLSEAQNKKLILRP